ncbi:MAG: LPS-assembly protein LptD [Parvibaculum sp.]|uniref:LPS-assembly protein LptD n=1 Tax=Parvibaculum sp. TaxID=2024848 RepID=UPI0026009FF8|nr:LPS-assembly protein LptD [Parvibaculum sp.]MCE9651092.1 LPS-assembly protein LptD [Parvibaculum sp.]
MGVGRRATALAATALTLVVLASLPARAATQTGPVAANSVVAPASTAAKPRSGAKAYPESGEVLMQADDLVYDRDSEIVTATGHVEIAYDGRILMADKVTYNQKTDVVTADGNVSLLETTGEVAFADHVVLRNKMKDGVVQTLSVLMTDKSRLAGHDAVRANGTVTTVHRGVYSPCEICKEKGEDTPLWQIKAFRVIHNTETKRIIYEDAFMEMFGVPVAYLPFFSHPDPTVKRQSGFLIPEIASSTDLGQEITIPYYWAIKPNMDATVAPRFTTEEGIVYQGEFRHRIAEGQYQFFGTGTWPKTQTAGTPGDSDFRGSLFGNGAFVLAPKWQWGFQAQIVSDNTYLRKYGLTDATDLTNNLYLNNIDGRDSFTANAYYFRNLLPTTNSDDTPWVAPIVDYQHDLGDLLGDGRLTFNSNAMMLGTPAGLDSRRLSASFDWEKPFTSKTGQVYRVFANLRGDVYQTDKAPDPNVPGTYYGEETIVRGLPTVGAEVSYPFVNSRTSLRQVIEPIAQIIYAPSIGNDDRIPNEDSINFEFDDTNLFSENRFPGLDRWETGARASAGIRYSVYGNDGAQASILLGQSYRLKEDTSFSTASGLRDQLSDYVGAIQIAPSNNLFIVHRFRVNQDNFKFSRNEFDVMAKTGPLSTQLGYAYFAKDQAVTTTTNAREEVSLGSVLKLSEYWRLFGNTTRDLTNSLTISNQIGVGYQDDCFGLAIGMYQSNISYQDIEKSNTFLVQITFKNLGTTGTGRSSGNTAAGIINPGSSVFGNPETSLFGDPAGWMYGGSLRR